jgi:hypothetical protein
MDVFGTDIYITSTGPRAFCHYEFPMFDVCKLWPHAVYRNEVSVAVTACISIAGVCAP